MACSHKVPGRRGRVCRLCVLDIGVQMCKNVQGMCSSAKVPAWECVEQTLQNAFGAWALDLNRKQVRREHTKHCVVRRVKELVCDSEEMPRIVMVEKMVIDAFGQAAWDDHCRQVRRAISCTQQVLSVALQSTVLSRKTKSHCCPILLTQAIEIYKTNKRERRKNAFSSRTPKQLMRLFVGRSASKQHDRTRIAAPRRSAERGKRIVLRAFSEDDLHDRHLKMVLPEALLPSRPQNKKQNSAPTEMGIRIRSEQREISSKPKPIQSKHSPGQELFYESLLGKTSSNRIGIRGIQRGVTTTF